MKKWGQSTLQDVRVRYCARNLLPPVALAVLFCFLAIETWRKWPNFYVDFGRELYIPWQLSKGKVLYKDIAHLFGPLSQYISAILFKFFGLYTIWETRIDPLFSLSLASHNHEPCWSNSGMASHLEHFPYYFNSLLCLPIFDISFLFA
ncbi:MAG: hypothetical protein OEM02_00800 [Desulfobulbaceae bacterium]|nr:hypothetical protein [Desulfobulbaceae bacterium]